MKKNNYKSWEKTSDLYCQWVSNNKVKNFFLEKIFFEDLSLWWANNLTSKDNVVMNKWFLDLNNLLFYKKKTYFNQLFYLFIFTMKFIKNFSREIFFILFLRIFFQSRKKKYFQPYVFHSYEYNFLKKDDSYFDKNYLIAPLKKYKSRNLFIINIVNKINFIKKIFFYKNIFSKLNLPYVVLDEYITIKDILAIYLNSLSNFTKILLFCNKKENKKIFFINGTNCRNILLPHLLNSFCGTAQEFILRAKSKYNFLKDNNKKIFICYGEFNPGYLASYHFVKKANPKTLTISIQHSYANKNLMFFKNYKNQFVNKNKNFISPMPDKYFVMGNHYKKILKKYYPKEIKIIGALRYDKLSKKKLKKKKMNFSKFTILVCPAIGDEETIINCLKDVDLKNFKVILSPHPVVFKKTILKFKNELGISFDYFSNYSSIDLISSVDLVLCSFSSMSLESLVIGKPSARLINENYPFHFDLKDGIKYFTDPNSLSKFLKNKKQILSQNFNKSICSNIFFKLDNKSYIRFWNSIPKNNF